MEYCNITTSHREIIKRCTADRLWIRHQGIYSPWDYLRKFGVCHIVHPENTSLVDPVEFIEQAISILKTKFAENVEPDLFLILLERTEEFTKKVMMYYQDDTDSHLLKSIETRVWQI